MSTLSTKSISIFSTFSFFCSNSALIIITIIIIIHFIHTGRRKDEQNATYFMSDIPLFVLDSSSVPAVPLVPLT